MRRHEPTFNARILISGSEIVYYIERKTIRFDIRDILLIGEFSAEPGTMGADYFFTFFLKGENNPLDVPAYAIGLFESLKELRKSLPDLQYPKLQMSTDFQSNILFPKKFAGKPFYEFLPESKPAINLPFLRNMVQVETVGKKLVAELVGKF